MTPDKLTDKSPFHTLPKNWGGGDEDLDAIVLGGARHGSFETPRGLSGEWQNSPEESLRFAAPGVYWMGETNNRDAYDR
ncbi:MAG: hypothetical protein JNG88_10570 [Phycisphaerales bacterium]|nr:hypothetical protein [Phycisphaerales bacterium]